ncbi:MULTISPECIES: hypothetical protein [unclassified Sinorhizobium]|uniref:hypothetical protein n=1 Tax=unclassified Sinorhizobium TaxID=2613772 RepID=UPI0035257061
MVYVACRWLTGQCAGDTNCTDRTIMGTKLAKAAFLIFAMMFFAVLALNIAVPALVLSVMALPNWLILSGSGAVQKN